MHAFSNSKYNNNIKINLTKRYLSQLMRLWYLSHKRLAKAQASLSTRAVSPEPSLFAHMKYGSRRSAIISWAGSFESPFDRRKIQSVRCFFALFIKFFRTYDNLCSWKYLSRLMRKPTKWLCAQRRLRSAWASAKSVQSLRSPHEESLGP